MYEILKIEEIAKETYMVKVKAPLIAKKFKPGHFVIVRVHEKGERIPLTIVEADEREGNITLIFKVVGKTTLMLSKMSSGDPLADIVGPLGNPSEIAKFGNVICIGGGVGIAPIYPIVKALKNAGNYVITIIGARSSDYLFLEKELSEISDEFYIATDDGSKGFKGFVTDILKSILEKRGDQINRVIVIGPTIMMKIAAEITRPFKIKTIASLNPIMVDGTGMCGACRVKVAGEIKFACVHGPEFDAHEVDFDELINRLNMYKELESQALEKYLGEKSEK